MGLKIDQVLEVEKRLAALLLARSWAQRLYLDVIHGIDVSENPHQPTAAEAMKRAEFRNNLKERKVLDEVDRQLYRLKGRMLARPEFRDKMQVLMVDVSIVATKIDAHHGCTEEQMAEKLAQGVDHLEDKFQSEPLAQQIHAIIADCGLECTDAGSGEGKIDLGCPCSYEEHDEYLDDLCNQFPDEIELGIIEVKAFPMCLHACSYTKFNNPFTLAKFVECHSVKMAEIKLES